MRRHYEPIEMPTAFVLETLTRSGEWIDHGLYRADQFTVNEDGSYLCSGDGGSPLFLRCVRQDGDVIYVVDGGGEPYTYRLVPFPSDRYQPSD